MPGEKSAATTCAPLAASDADDRHVPAARSRIFSPGLGFTARVVARRHTASSPNVMAIFVKSYRFATRSNMPLTVFGSLARSARCEVTRRVYAGLLAFFWSRFGALRRWGAADPALAVGCVSRKADEEGAPACADEDNAADRTLAFGCVSRKADEEGAPACADEDNAADRTLAFGCVSRKADEEGAPAFADGVNAADRTLAVGCASRKADEEGAPACADEDNAADRTLAFGCVSRKADEEGAPACADEDNAADRTLAFGCVSRKADEE